LKLIVYVGEQKMSDTPRVIQADYLGSWNIGAFGIATDKFALLGFGFRASVLENIKNVLRVPIITASIMQEPIVGILVAANSNGLLIPKQTDENEVNKLRESLADSSILVERIVFKNFENALGNLLLVNDKGCLIHESLIKNNKREIETIEDVLNVEVVGINSKFLIMGTLAGVNNIGALVHPLLSEDEIDVIKNVLKVRVEKGTINRGTPYIRSGVIVNSYGLVIGARSTGIEVHRAYDIFLRES